MLYIQSYTTVPPSSVCVHMYAFSRGYTHTQVIYYSNDLISFRFLDQALLCAHHCFTAATLHDAHAYKHGLQRCTVLQDTCCSFAQCVIILARVLEPGQSDILSVSVCSHSEDAGKNEIKTSRRHSRLTPELVTAAPGPQWHIKHHAAADCPFAKNVTYLFYSWI